MSILWNSSANKTRGSLSSTHGMIDTFLYKQYNSLDSTQLEARRLLASAGCQQNTVLIAKRQSGGFGRYGRVWYSNTGDVIMTIILKPVVPVELWSQICYISALAIGETLLQYLNSEQVSYKWVNDVLVDGRKIAGILLETCNANVATGSVDGLHLLIGIGCNIIRKKHENILSKTTSLQEHSIRVSASSFIDVALLHFREFYNHWLSYGFSSIRERWLLHAAALGHEIDVRFMDKQERGVFQDIDDKGNLLLKRVDGASIIRAGDVFMI